METRIPVSIIKVGVLNVKFNLKEPIIEKQNVFILKMMVQSQSYIFIGNMINETINFNVEIAKLIDVDSKFSHVYISVWKKVNQDNIENIKNSNETYFENWVKYNKKNNFKS